VRLSSLTLDHYGPFEHRELLFDTTPGRLNLLLAPNGWGKSVIRRAVGDLLFDLPPHSPMHFQYVSQKLRLCARIEAPDGEVREVVRRKGRGNTLTDHDNTPVPAEAFKRLTGPADRVLFEELFALDTALLRKGGDALLATGGRLGQVLFAGSGGLARIRNLLDRLIEQRDAIGRADRKQCSKPLWSALSAVEQAGRDLREAALRPEQWRALEKRAAEAEAELMALRAERAEVEARLAELRQVRNLRPWLARRGYARERLAAIGDVPHLDPTFEKRWRAALEARAQTASAARAKVQQEAEAREAAAGISVDTGLLEAGDAIDIMAARRGSAVQAMADLPEVAAKLREEEGNVLRLRRELGWSRCADFPPMLAVRDAQARLKTRAALAAAADQAEREHAEAVRRLAAAEQAVCDLAMPQDFGSVSAVLAELRVHGDPMRHLDKLQHAVREAESALSAALAAVPDRRLSVAELDATRAPSEPTLASAEAALTRAEGLHTAAFHERDRVRTSIRQQESKLAALVQDGALPDLDALPRARAARDGLWEAVQRALASPASDRDPSVPIAFDRALRRADAAADALIAQTAQLGEAAALRASLVALAAEHSTAEAACAAAAEGLAQACAAFGALTGAAGARSDASPAIFRAFLRARHAAVERRLALDRHRAEAEAAQNRIAAHAERLAICLPGAPTDLATLMRETDRRIAAAAELETARTTATQTLRMRQAEAKTRADDLELARRNLANWEAEWCVAVAAVSLPEGASAEAAEAALSLIEELRVAETARSKDAPRVADMQASLTVFASEVSGLVAGLAPELADRPPSDSAAQLVRRLQDARESAAKARALRERLAEATEAAVRARDQAAEADRQLAVLRSVLRADTDEAAEAQLRCAREAGEAARVLADAEQNLLEIGGGESFEALEALVSASTPEADDVAIAELTARHAALSERAETAAADARSAAEERDRHRGSTNAADAAVRREAALAALTRSADEGLVLHAAVSLLQAGLERQRGASESGLVQRIGEAFRGLTCGAHAGVAIEEDNRSQRLVALEADGGGRKRIEDLSEGTRDQLYLSLRSVALEEYAAAEPALPFIADDILQTFDDSRALASLNALLDLSRHVQVIALTHHPHVLSLATALPSGSVHSLVLAEA
jgi:uncharacterized protein YhaN